MSGIKNAVAVSKGKGNPDSVSETSKRKPKLLPEDIETQKLEPVTGIRERKIVSFQEIADLRDNVIPVISAAMTIRNALSKALAAKESIERIAGLKNRLAMLYGREVEFIKTWRRMDIRTRAAIRDVLLCREGPRILENLQF